MTYHHDLLEQASHLAKRETKKPRQASLRRAVSAAYYALFHLLVAEGAKQLSPKKADGLNLLVGRAFNHSDMRNVCKNFAEAHSNAIKTNPKPSPAPIQKLIDLRLITLPIDARLFAVCQAFIELQEARNEADYNLGKQWNRLDVLTHIQTARQAFDDWKAICNSLPATVFVAALLLQRHWGR